MITLTAYTDMVDTATRVKKMKRYFNVLNPSQIVSRLTFLISSLTTRLIQSFVQNITFFVVYWFINRSSSKMT